MTQPTSDPSLPVRIETDARGAKFETINYTHYYIDCRFCQREKASGNTFFPSHYAGRNCESGSRDHCTCDSCF